MVEAYFVHLESNIMFDTNSKVKPSTKPLTQPEPPHLQVNMSRSPSYLFCIFVRTHLLHNCEELTFLFFSLRFIIDVLHMNECAGREGES